MAKVTFHLNLSDFINQDQLDQLTKSDKKDILKNINEFAIDRILSDVGNQMNVVTGKPWRKTLSKEYKEFKVKEGGRPYANLELHGDMLDALKGKVVDDNTSEIGIFNNEQAMKADGHCHTEVFGISKLPLRQFIPNEFNGETLRSGIMRDLVRLAKSLVNDAIQGE